MKLSIVFFAAAIFCAYASPLAETPSVRGPSQGCKDKWTQTVMGLSLVTTVAKAKLAACAMLQMLKMSYWFTSTTAQLQLHIDAGSVMGNAISGQMLLGYPASQVTIIQGYIQTCITSMQFSVQAVEGANAAQGKAMQAQLLIIQANFSAVITQMQAVASTASIFSSLYMIVTDIILTQLTVTVQAAAQLQNDCGAAYSDANSQSPINALLMDIVIATTQATKQLACTAVQVAVAGAVSVTQTAVQTVIFAQSIAMQGAASVAQVTMTTVSSASAAGYAVLCTAMYLQTQFDVQILITAIAGIESGTTEACSESVANITDANNEYTAMCNDTSDADNITATVQSITIQITTIMQSQSSINVQMCASVAIAAVLVQQTQGHNGIGQCVSDGKNKNDGDMQDINQNYTACVQENQKNETTCANKYADQTTTGNEPSNTDSGANKSEKMKSCSDVSFTKFIFYT